MQPDYQPNPYTVKRPRRGFILVLSCLALAIAAWLMLRTGDAGEGERDQVRGGGAPASEINRGSTDVVGTTGEARPRATENNSGPAAVVPPAIIQELSTITGSVDGHELIGRRVDLHVPVQRVATDVAFWVGEGDNRILVVKGRDNRTGAERQRGLPSDSGIPQLSAGQQVTVSGSVQRLPKAEEMYSWQLSRNEAAELMDRKIYLRADTVAPNGH